MRVLIAGCYGQVGECLVRLLQGKVELLAVGKEELDITNRNDVMAMVLEFKPDFIINAAAFTAVDKAEEEIELAQAVNRDGPKFLAEASATIGGVIIHISTDYVFTGNKDGLYCEDDVVGPLSIYGKSKLAGEQAIIECNEKHIILRTAWIFGEHGSNFVKTMLRLAKKQDVINIVCDQYGGPTYAGDIAYVLVCIMQRLWSKKEKQHYGIYHFSGEPHVNWCDFAQAIFAEAERNSLIVAPKVIPIATEAYPTLAVRPANSKMDCSKIYKIFSIKPSDWNLQLKNIQNYMEQT